MKPTAGLGAARARGRARAAQLRDGRALGGRRPRQRARRRLGVEGRARSSLRSCSRSARAAGFRSTASRRDWLAVAFGAFVVLYALLPQSWLDGGATTHGVLLGLRHDGLPVAAYFLGRALDLTARELRQVFRTILATGRRGRRVRARRRLRDPARSGGATRARPAGSASSSASPTRACRACRRTSSTTRATSVRCAGSSRRSSRRSRPRTCSWSRCSCCAGSRATGCAAGCSRSGRASRCSSPGCSGRTRARRTSRSRSDSSSTGSRGAGVGGAPARARRRGVRGDRVGCGVRARVPRTSGRRRRSRRRARRASGRTRSKAARARGDDRTRARASRRRASTWRASATACAPSLRHPQGFGLGNAGSTASRTGVEIKAGESTYTELGVDTGLLGGLVFLAWSAALLWRIRHAALVARGASPRCSRSGCRPT